MDSCSQPDRVTWLFLSNRTKLSEPRSKNKTKESFEERPRICHPAAHGAADKAEWDRRGSSRVPDGAAEQDGVLQDDGESRAQRLQRQLGDVDVVDDDPPLEGKWSGPGVTRRATFACDVFTLCPFADLQTCPPCGRRPERRRTSRCPSCHRSPPGNGRKHRHY